MQRKEFMRSCGFACLGLALGNSLLTGCATGNKMVKGDIGADGISIPLSDFLNKKQDYLPYVVVNNTQLKYPICVYRLGPESYTALLMRCPHQGSELQVFGDRLQCPAHGSEFDDHGKVQEGPAMEDLRTFTVKINKDQINIVLR